MYATWKGLVVTSLVMNTYTSTYYLYKAASFFFSHVMHASFSPNAPSFCSRFISACLSHFFFPLSTTHAFLLYTYALAFVISSSRAASKTYLLREGFHHLHHERILYIYYLSALLSATFKNVFDLYSYISVSVYLHVFRLHVHFSVWCSCLLSSLLSSFSWLLDYLRGG